MINDQDWQFAATVCRGVDSKDVSYVALSESTGLPLITRDKLLHTGLRKKGFRNVMLFDAFLEEMQG